MNHSHELSLFELNGIVKNALKGCFPDRYWVRAELSDVKENYSSGHCYIEFVEKENRKGNIIAKARGNIWAMTWKLLKPYFEEQTRQKFTAGIKVLVEVTVEFHELYGYSLTVTDIDPSYTMGDMARHRAEILKQLEEEGVKDMNKELELSDVPNRIAVISSATAAGFGDFMNQLGHNMRGYRFETHLFPAVMQGSQTEESIIAALDKIYRYQHLFDAVVLIRGGGATSDLNSFDSYLLALNCAQFPLPIITGIGHERDETVLDSIAHTRVKTPTAAAEFLIGKMDEAYERVLLFQDAIDRSVRELVENEKQRLNTLTDAIPYLVRERMVEENARTAMVQSRIVSLINLRLSEERNALQRLSARIPHLARNMVHAEETRLEILKERILTAVPVRIAQAKQKLENLEQVVELVSPDNILRKGYSLTLVNGKVIRSSRELKRGDRMTTLLQDGNAESIVTDLKYDK